MYFYELVNDSIDCHIYYFNFAHLMTRWYSSLNLPIRDTFKNNVIMF